MPALCDVAHAPRASGSAVQATEGENASCFGLACPKRGQCVRYALVDEPQMITTMATCRQAGGYPLFLAEPTLRTDPGAVAGDAPTSAEQSWPWLAMRWAREVV